MDAALRHTARAASFGMALSGPFLLARKNCFYVNFFFLKN
jgi:hypothetical protein